MTRYTDQEIEDKVRDIVCDIMRVEQEKVQLTTDLSLELFIDDLALVEIAMDCEDTFDIELPDDIDQTVTTFGDLVKTVKKANKVAS